MLLASLILILGFIVGIVVVQVWELRLSGVLVVPLLAVYTLYNFVTLPVFILSTIAAYIALHIIQNRTVLYGREFFLAGIAVGALVPLLAVVLSVTLYGTTFMTEVEFIGTILPGIAAYNLHQLSLDRRITDAIISLGVLTALVAIGVALVHPHSPIRLESTFAPVLVSAESDVAQTQGVALSVSAHQGVLSPVIGKVVVLSGLVISEFLRSRWGLRPGGVIAMPLLGVFAMQDASVVPLYVITLVAAYLVVVVVERQTLLYGRTVLSLALVVSVAVGPPTAALVGADIGLISLFTAIFAGIGAYNFRLVPAVNRAESVLVAAGLFTLSLAVLRAVVTPAPDGVLFRVSVIERVLIGIILIASVLSCYSLDKKRPSLQSTDHVL